MVEAELQGHDRRRRRPRILVWAGLLAVLLAAALVAVALWKTIASISTEAALARDQIVAGARIVGGGGAGLTSQQSVTARNDFRSAAVHFDHVNKVLSDSAIFRVVGILPWFKDQLRATENLSNMGVHVSRAGDLGVQIVDLALAEHQAGTPGEKAPGQQILNTLQAIDPLLNKLGPEIDQAAAARQQIPSSGLVSQLQNAIWEFDRKLDVVKLHRDVAALRSQEPAIQRLLGSSGPQTYLVLEQDPAELRATGGFIGSVAFLTFDHGRIAPFEPIDVGAIDTNALGTLGFGSASTGVPAPTPLVEAFHLNSLTLRDSNWSPDFPTSARQAELLLERETGRKVDGVIAIDPHLMARALEITGPIKVPETGDILDSHNFFATTLNRVELNLSANHKSFLGAAAKAIVPRLFAIPRSQWLPMLQVLSWGCDSRSLQAYFHTGDLESLVKGYGCAGQLEVPSGDQLMVVDSNLGGNKDDFWLQRQFSLNIAMQADGTARHTLLVHYSGLEPHDIHLTQYRGYTGWLRIYLPPSSVLVRSSGAQLQEGTDLGRRVVEGWVFVPFYKNLDVTITYDVGAADMRTSSGRVQFFWQKQGGRVADPISVELTPPPRSVLKNVEIDGEPVHRGPTKSDLAVDRRFTFEYR